MWWGKCATLPLAGCWGEDFFSIWEFQSRFSDFVFLCCCRFYRNYVVTFWILIQRQAEDEWMKCSTNARHTHDDELLTYLSPNSMVNHITTMISMTNKYASATTSYSWIVEKTLKAKHVKTMKKLQWKEKKFCAIIKVCDDTFHAKIVSSFQQTLLSGMV